MLEDLSCFLEVVAIRLVVGLVFWFQKTREAYSLLEQAGHFGKVVIEIAK
ncbi:hypothetical protein LT85_1335 [Collimonas arenae]|uniref:Uncharacterized protein n=1 Tax=Collimonas arenae TaxID=279058 RepID=A0A0A1F6Y8_9BURK|nr:zinc-binding dehydrogenase [Collimonas arenae]AIY40493.1 hypothetical protein LT85_1335 [Collimonas arenae]